MAGIGNVPLPEDFKYRDVLLKGRPRHEKTDPFRIRHPVMDTGKRAKIFAPFDALRGFSAVLLETEAKENAAAWEGAAQAPETEEPAYDESP